jgi:glutaredoxin
MGLFNKKPKCPYCGSKKDFSHRKRGSFQTADVDIQYFGTSRRSNKKQTDAMAL